MIYIKKENSKKEVIRVWIKKNNTLKKIEPYFKKEGIKKLINENYLIANGNGRDAKIYFGNNFDITTKFRFKAKFKMGTDKYIPYIEKGFSAQNTNSYLVFGTYFGDGKIQASKNEPNSFAITSNEIFNENQIYEVDFIIDNINNTIKCNDFTFKSDYGNYNANNKFTKNNSECILNFLNKTFKLYRFTIGGDVNGVYKEFEFDLAEAKGERIIKSLDGKLTARLGADVNCLGEVI